MFGREGGREKGFKCMDGDASCVHCCMSHRVPIEHVLGGTSS